MTDSYEISSQPVQAVQPEVTMENTACTNACPETETAVDRRPTLVERLNLARSWIYESKLAKTGTVTGRFRYFDRPDFMPLIIRANQMYGICSYIDLSGVDGFRGQGRLILCCSDRPEEQITFSMPAGSCSTKGSQIQDVGALVTYMSRYLYIMAYEISESDPVDWSNSNNISREYAVQELQRLGTDFSRLAEHYQVQSVNEMTDQQVFSALSLKQAQAARQ